MPQNLDPQNYANLVFVPPQPYHLVETSHTGVILWLLLLMMMLITLVFTQAGRNRLLTAYLGLLKKLIFPPAHSWQIVGRLFNRYRLAKAYLRWCPQDMQMLRLCYGPLEEENHGLR